MINSNLNATAPRPNVYVQNKVLKIDFSPDQRQEVLASLEFLGPGLSNFIEGFFNHFTTHKTKEFIFKHTEESLTNMLSSSLNLIISSIDQPIPLVEYITIIEARLPHFKDLLKNKDLFIKSFMNALVDSFQGNYTERLGKLWFKAVTSYVNAVFRLYNL